MARNTAEIAAPHWNQLPEFSELSAG